MRVFERWPVIFMALVLIASFMPIGFAETYDASTGDTAVKRADAVSASAGSAIISDESRIAKCVTFVSNNNLDERPKVTCARLLNKELDCAEFLKSKNVAEPAAKCDAFFGTAAVAAKRAASAKNDDDEADEKRMRIAERVSKEGPLAKAFVEKLTEDKIKVFSALPRAEQNRIMEMDESERMKELGKYRITTVNKDMLFKKREIAKDKLEDAKENYEMAKKEYQRVNKAYDDKKELFNDAKKKLKECEKEDNESDACAELKAQIQEHAKEYIINGAQMAIEHLNKIKNKVESAEGMDQEKADEIIADIDKTIAELEDAIDKVRNAETKEEVKDGAKDVAEAWKKIKHAEKVYAERVLHSNMWNIIKKSEQLEKRMEDARDRIDENGIDVSAFDEKITQFSEKISSAKEKFNESEELLREAAEMRKENATNEEIREKVNEANAKLREAHNDIKEAYKIFASIIRDINARGGKITDDDDDDETEVVEEVNDDDADDGEEEEEEIDSSLPTPSADNQTGDVQADDDDDDDSQSGEDTEDHLNETSEDTDSPEINETA